MSPAPAGYRLGVTCFSSRNVSRADVPAARSRIWDVLTSPLLLAQMTPLLDHIEVDGDHWCWKLSGVRALGVEVAPSFTEHMTFEPESRITFRHDPPGGAERAGADGVYLLEDNDDGSTHLCIDITLSVDLPLPRASRRAVQRVMSSMMHRTGDVFGNRLYRHLGVDPSEVRRTTTVG